MDNTFNGHNLPHFATHTNIYKIKIILSYLTRDWKCIKTCCG